VYTHIKVLEQMQFVEHENLGRLKVYRTTPKFQNYFGITDLNAVKSKLVTTTTSTTATTTKTSKHIQQRPTTKDTRSQSTAAGAAAAGEAGTTARSQSPLPEKT
jgi:segregation and condensation protein B